jgi:hypothetical protein
MFLLEQKITNFEKLDPIIWKNSLIEKTRSSQKDFKYKVTISQARVIVLLIR